MFTWQLSPRIITPSHDLVVGRAPQPEAVVGWLVEALNEVMFNQQTIGSAAMTHGSSMQVHETWKVILPRLQRAKYGKGV